MKNQIIDENFLSRLETVSMYMRNPMRGYFGGAHRTKSYGSTVEFADFREYTLGDDIRRIDWNIYSRFEKFFIRLFVDEKQMHVQIFLDGSASMFKGDSDKAKYAMRAAAGLGYLSIRNMDKTSIRVIKGEHVEDMGGVMNGKNAYYQGISELDKMRFGGTADLGVAITGCLNPGYDDGLTVIISDFLTHSDYKKAVDYLLYRRRQVMLIQVLSPEELNPDYNGKRQLLDSESDGILDSRNMKMRINRQTLKIYQQALTDYKQEIQSFCASRGVPFFSVSSSENVEKLIFEKLNEWEVVR
ncbi:MAG: DUF58 domain-containing protein [Firmicutes bacterium]|nr:DUF58 domain-containing protein [Bacillota bacterium]